MMKKVILFFALIISIASFAQTSFPVSIANKPTSNISNDLITTIKREGRLRVVHGYVQQGTPRSTVNAGVSTGGAGSQPLTGKHTFLENLLITTDRSCLIGVVIKSSSWDVTGQTFYFTTGSSSSTVSNSVVIPLNILIRDGGSYAVYIQQNDTGEAPENGATWMTYEVTADLNIEAERTILLCGDSTTWSSMGNDPDGNPYDGQTLYGFQLRDKIMDSTRVSTRLVNKGFGGSSSPDWKKALRSGELEGTAYDLLIVSLGLNDAGMIGGSYTIQVFKDNLKLFAKHRDRYRKNASILFLAPSATDKTSWMAQIAAIRTAVSDVVTELGGSANKVYFVNQDNAFTLNATATADTNITTGERTAGGRVHPSGAGHTLIANYIWAQAKNWLYTNLK